MLKPEAGNVTIKRLGTLGFGLYGAPGYVDARTAGADAATFDADDFIGWAESHSHLPAAKWIARMGQGRPCRLELNTLSGQMAAALAGLGLAVLPHFLAKRAGLEIGRAHV